MLLLVNNTSYPIHFIVGQLILVPIASRSKEMAESAKKDLDAGEQLSYILVDLACFKSVHAFVNQVQEKIPKGSIDILISMY